MTRIDDVTTTITSAMNDLDRQTTGTCNTARNVHPATMIARALDAAGHLLPDPIIIRTPADLEALDPDTLLIPEGFNSPITRQSMDNFGITVSDAHYAVVVATGEHTRACREALEGGLL